jgi:hypothetical protein
VCTSYTAFTRTKGLYVNPHHFLSATRENTKNDLLSLGDENGVREKLLADDADASEYTEKVEKAKYDLLPEFKALLPALTAGGAPAMGGWQGKEYLPERLSKEEQAYLIKNTPDASLCKLDTSKEPAFVDIAVEKLGMDRQKLMSVIGNTRANYGRSGTFVRKKVNVDVVALNKALALIAQFRSGVEVTEKQQINVEQACYRALLFQGHSLMHWGEEMLDGLQKDLNLPKFKPFREFLVSPGKLTVQQEATIMKNMVNLGQAQKAVREATNTVSQRGSGQDFGKAVPTDEDTNATRIAAEKEKERGPTALQITGVTTTPAKDTKTDATVATTNQVTTTPTPGTGPTLSLVIRKEKGKVTIKVVRRVVEKVDTKVVAKVAESNRSAIPADGGTAFKVFTANIPPGMSEDLRRVPPPHYYAIHQVFEDTTGCTRVVRRLVRRARAGVARDPGSSGMQVSKVCTRGGNVPLPSTMVSPVARHDGVQMAEAGRHGLGCTTSPTTDSGASTVSGRGAGRSRDLGEVQGAPEDKCSGDSGPGKGQASVLEGSTNSSVPLTHLPDTQAAPAQREQNASGNEGERIERSTDVRGIQTRRDIGCEGNIETRRLCDQTGSEECLLPDPSDSPTASATENKSSGCGQEFASCATVPRREPGCEADTRKVHQTVTGVTATVQSTGNKTGDQDRRRADTSTVTRTVPATHLHCDQGDSVPGVCMEAGEVLVHPLSPNRIPRSNVLFHSPDVLDAGGQMLPRSPAHRTVNRVAPVTGGHYGLSPANSESEGHVDGNDRDGKRDTPTHDRASRLTTGYDADPNLQEERVGHSAHEERVGSRASGKRSDGAETAGKAKRKSTSTGDSSKQLRLEWAPVRQNNDTGNTMDRCMRLSVGTSTHNQVGTGAGSSVPVQCKGGTRMAHHEEGNGRPSARPRNSAAYVSTNQGWNNFLQDRRDNDESILEEGGGSSDSPEPTDLECDSQSNPETGDAEGRARSRSQKHFRRTVETSFRTRGIQSESTDLQQAGVNVGRSTGGLVRGAVEQQVSGVRKQARMGPGGDARRCDEFGLGGAAGATLCAPTSSQAANSKHGTQSTEGASTADLSGGTAVEAAVACGSPANDCDPSDSITMQVGAITSAGSIHTGTGTPTPGLVNTLDVEMVCCFKYVRWALHRRGYSTEMANGFQSLYKQKSGGGAGGDHHRKHWHRFWMYLWKATGGGGWFIVSDVAICNCARQLELQTESHVRAFLSSISVIMEVAWGHWTRETFGRKLAIQQARLNVRSGPKYHEAVDNCHMWLWIVKACLKANRGKPLTNMQLRDITMLLFKCATGCRSSDMYNWDARDFAYCIPLNDKGNMVNTFAAATKMLIRFKDPKDPLCVVKHNERWSHAFIVQRIRVDMLVNPNCEWLRNAECVQSLDLFHHLQSYVTRFKRYLYHPDPVAKVKNNPAGCLVYGHFWMNVTVAALPGADGFTRPAYIKASTIGERTKKMYKTAGYTTTVVDDSTPAERSLQTNAIAGHMTRGNFESLMYRCGGDDALFDKYDAVAMCRHSIPTFFHSYHRDVPLRTVNAFERHPHMKDLNMTEVSVQ